MSVNVVGDFIEKLVERAQYGVQGEKPLAVIATLNYLYEYKLLGQSFIELIDDPKHSSNIKSYFMRLANDYGRLKDPNASWNVITGTDEELQNATRDFRVDESFARLMYIDIKSLLDRYFKQLERAKKRNPQESIVIKKRRAFKRYNDLLNELKSKGKINAEERRKNVVLWFKSPQQRDGLVERLSFLRLNTVTS